MPVRARSHLSLSLHDLGVTVDADSGYEEWVQRGELAALGAFPGGKDDVKTVCSQAQDRPYGGGYVCCW